MWTWIVCLGLLGGCGGDETSGSDGGDTASEESGVEDISDLDSEGDDASVDSDTLSEDGGESEEGGPVPATFYEVMTVFNQSCSFSSCHGSAPNASKNGNLTLTEEQAWASLVNVVADNGAALAEGTLLVSPGDSDASYLIFKMEMPWADAGGVHGNPMPDVDGARLPPESLALIRSWIDAGALDN